jgi:hypothetical protein
MFTQDGNKLALSGGKGSATLDFFCLRCHQGASPQEFARFASFCIHDDMGNQTWLVPSNRKSTPPDRAALFCGPASASANAAVDRSQKNVQ